MLIAAALLGAGAALKVKQVQNKQPEGSKKELESLQKKLGEMQDAQTSLKQALEVRILRAIRPTS
jgi:hypothetical protein